MLDLVEEYRTALVEAVAERDEDLMMKYLEGEELTIEELKAGIRSATLAVDIIPVLCGTSYKNKGVQPLLDAIIDYMPSPLEVPAIIGTVPGTEEETERHSSDEEPFSALAFKILTDPYVGKLAFPVYSGTLKSGSMYNLLDKRKRVGRILLMHTNHRRSDEVYAGICSSCRFRDTTTGDTLCLERTLF